MLTSAAITFASYSPPPADASSAWGGQNYLTAGTFTWTVPTGVNTVRVAVSGGTGGGVSSAQAPNQLIGYLQVPSGTTQLEVNVGGNGAPPNTNGSNASGGSGGLGGAGGSGGQGKGMGGSGTLFSGGGGGGASDIRPTGAPMSGAYLVGGGGGGVGGDDGVGSNSGGGGGPGGLSPQPGQAGSGVDGGSAGAAGTPTSGAATNGQNYGDGVNAGGGGGGGGFGGGGGGGAGSAWLFSLRSGSGGGGGGGLSYANPSVITWSREAAPSAPMVTLTWLLVTGPTTPSATVGQYSSHQYVAGGGIDGATWELTSGSLPPGMSFGSDTTYGQAFVDGTPTTPGTYTYTLSASTTYAGESQLQSSITSTMTVAPGAASAAATAARPIGTTTATLNGEIETGGAAASGIECVYWPTSTPGSTTTIPAVPSSVAAGGSKSAVACNVTGLSSATGYSYQVRATVGSSITSNTATFTTGSALATVTTANASAITRSSATGNGTVTSTQAVTGIACRIATTLAGVAAGTSVTATPSTTSGGVTDLAVTCPFTGLAANTPYYYGVFATDSAGTATSTTFATFTTRAAPPAVTGAAAGDVTSSSASITANVTATNNPVTAIYCRVAPLGTPVANGTLVSATPSVADATAADLPVRCSLTGLSPATAYVARAYATDSDGTGANPTVTRFTTTAAPGGGGGASPSPSPSQVPSISTTPAQALPQVPTRPTEPAATWVRLLPGLALIENVSPHSLATTRTKEPARRSIDNAPRAILKRATPTVVTVKGLGANRSVIVNVARSGADKPRWRHLTTTRAGRDGAVVLPPLAITSGTFNVRFADSSGVLKYAVLSSRRR